MFIFNKAMEDATYPNRMKIAKVLALFKKNPKYVPENIDQLVYYQVWIKSLRK